MTPSHIFMLIISLAGFLVGFILSIISPEELRPGKKYFILIHRILFSIIIIHSIYFSIYIKQLYLITIPASFLVLYLVLLRKRFIKDYFYLKEISNYLFFIITYFLIITLNGQNFKLLFLSLVFIYGLPAGTLLRFGFIRKQERKHEHV